MTTDDDMWISPSGAEYHLPVGEEVERIDAYIRRLQLSKATDKYPDEVDFLLEARSSITSQTGETP